MVTGETFGRSVTPAKAGSTREPHGTSAHPRIGGETWLAYGTWLFLGDGAQHLFGHLRIVTDLPGRLDGVSPGEGQVLEMSGAKGDLLRAPVLVGARPRDFRLAPALVPSGEEHRIGCCGLCLPLVQPA